MSADLVSRLLAHLDTVERVASEVQSPGEWHTGSFGDSVEAEGWNVASGIVDADAVHIAAQDPAAVLRLVRAHRDIVVRLAGHVATFDKVLARSRSETDPFKIPSDQEVRWWQGKADEAGPLLALLARGYGLEENQT